MSRSGPPTGDRAVRRARELREQLAAVSDSVPDLRSWFFHRMLGLHELMLGDADAAIEHYDIAYSQLPTFAHEMPEREQLKTIYEVGVAHMRDGENRNCSLRHNSDSCIFPIRGGGVHVDQEGSRNAIRYFTEVLQRAPRDSDYHVKARWLLNICHMTLAEYPDNVSPEYLIPPSAFEPDGEIPRFVNIGNRLGLGLFDLAGGAVVDDMDGDHDLDILVSTSDVHGQMRLFVNNADGSFTDRTVESGLTGLTGGLSMIQTDYDNDGDQDVFEQMGGFYPGDAFANALYENPGFGNHWLKIRLSGVRSNRPGIGARIRVDVVDDGKPRSIHRQVGTGGKFGGNPLRQEIGLGRATRIERLEVHWPTSDTLQVFENLEVDRAVIVTEGELELRRVELEAFSFSE